MSKIGGFNPQVFQQSFQQSEGTSKKGKSDSATGTEKSESKEETEEAGDLPSVGLGGGMGNEAVERYTGGSAATQYIEEAEEQHNDMSVRGQAHSELLGQTGAKGTGQNSALQRELETLQNRMKKLEAKIQGTAQTGPTQNVQSVQRTAAPQVRNVGRTYGGSARRQAQNLATEQAAPIADKKQANALEDDLPRVGLHK